MGEIQAGFGAGLSHAIEALGVAEGEIDNVLEAALRDIAENVVRTMADSWPLGERRTPSQMGVHSADLWEARQIEKLIWEIRNNAGYATFVHSHPNQGGPPGLGDRVLPKLIDQIEDEPLRFVTARVFELRAGGS